MGEKDLWFEFKKWGDVREIFIAKNRNGSGRRYGFVPFKGVEDVRKLERQLEQHGRERKLTRKFQHI